jgi:branched-chain amino acid transport system substrate-binding protein
MSFWRAAAAAALIVVGAAFGSGIEAGQRAMRIGVQLPLSGERAAVGRTIKSGVEMAVEAVNREGGVGGVPVEVIYEDDQDTEQGAREALKKLVQDHQVVAVVGELFSRYVIACRDIVEEAGVPYLTGGTSPRTTEQTRWIFRVGASDAVLANLLARYAVADLKLNKLAILHDRTGIHNARAEMVVKVLQERYGIEPLVRAGWKPGDRDFTPQLLQIKGKPVQAILALGETGEAGPFLRQVKALGLQTQVIAHRDFGTTRALEEAGGAAEGVVIMTEYIPALQEPERQAWARAYQERYGTEANVISAQYYDAVLLLAEAAKRGGASREGVRLGLEKLKGFRGVMADYTFDAKRNGVHRLYVAEITAGRPTLVTILEESL